jgi:hypothetical protein
MAFVKEGRVVSDLVNSDLVKIAMKRHEELKAEMGQIERFLKTAAELMGLDKPACTVDPAEQAPAPKDGEATGNEATGDEAKAESKDAAAADGSPETAAAGGKNFTPLFRPVSEESDEDIDLRKAING